ncbi:ribonucleotide-diphosphate reductase subunit beta [Aerococcaceae bacterium DSM 111020]|nr:ribonucleotide-diphosphate reductase subunit beta [Aerococcaceae bacterium DSM 111020]
MSRIQLYTKTTCPWCDKLKLWFQENDIDYEEINIESDEEALEFIRSQGFMTVPQVFIDGIHRPHEPVYSGLLPYINNEPLEGKTKPNVTKRDGKVVSFDGEKIKIAIQKANNETKEMTTEDVSRVAEYVIDKIDKNPIHVEEIQDLVEMELMHQEFPKTAKAYILYRAEQSKLRKRDIFKPRKILKPYEYPELESYKEAIQHSYWLHTEYNYTSDIQDYKINVKPHERVAIRNAMLAISQVEVSVKTFWAKLYDRLPKPELANVGMTFAESEVRHSDAYSHLLELLGLNEIFEEIDEIPALNRRVDYLNSHIKYSETGDDRDYAISVLLFSAFIEHISLFSQFLIIMSFNKHKNLFSGISNVIEATSKEEQLHGEFGVDLINTIKEENPDWFDETMAEEIYNLVKEAYESEKDVLAWIYEDGEIDFMPEYTVQEFIKNRLNNSLEAIGLERIFETDDEEVEKTLWFDEEIVSTKHVDFFAKRSVNYTKRSQSVTADDLF